MAQSGLVWPSLAWYGPVWPGMAQSGMALFGLVWVSLVTNNQVILGCVDSTDETQDCSCLVLVGRAGGILFTVLFVSLSSDVLSRFFAV